jgi:hypothetical protein
VRVIALSSITVSVGSVGTSARNPRNPNNLLHGELMAHRLEAVLRLARRNWKS